MNKTLLLVTFLALSLSACNPTKKDIGAITGGTLGAVAGSKVGGGSGQLVATAIGAMIGMSIGSSVGESMDELDALKMNRSLEYAPSGQTTKWVNPDSGNRYSVTPTNTHRSPQGHNCRDFQTTAVIDGNAEIIRSSACRNNYGEWVSK